MPRYAGIKSNNICYVSSEKKISSQLQIVPVPNELDTVSANDLILYYKYIGERFISKKAKKDAKDLKVAFVSNYAMKCGIASFAEALWPEINKHLGDYKIFIEENDNPTKNIVDEKISICWKRGEPLTLLIKEIKEFNPDIVWINHEFGLFPNARYWLSMMTQLSDYRIITTMHSVFHHMDKALVEAAMPEIVVHLQEAVHVLKAEKQIFGQVYLIPHGCHPKTEEKKLWNFYKSDKTFMQFGFGLRYKAFETSIKAAALLKNKYSDVFFTGLFSESDFAKTEHHVYFNELLDLVSSLGLEENVSLIRGFQSDNIIDAFLRTNQAAVFPYADQKGHSVYGASGAGRYALSKGLPVISSRHGHFSDLPTIKADTPEEIAQALEEMFINKNAKEEQIVKQFKYIEEHSWAKMAEKYIALFQNPPI